MKIAKYSAIFVLLVIVLFIYGYSSKMVDSTFAGTSDLVFSKSDKLLYIVQQEAQRIDVLNIKNLKIERSVDIDDKPTKIMISKKDKLLILVGVDNGRLLIYDRKKLKPESDIPVGNSPCDIVETNENYLICNRFSGLVTVVSKKSLSVVNTIQVGREPIAMTFVPTKNQLLVAHHLPEMASTDSIVAAKITIIDTKLNNVIKTFLLPNGSNGVKNIRLSSDCKYAFVTHVIAKYHMPTTQLERGWMNTNALSIIDVDNEKLWQTVLLDDIDRGASNPWAITCSEDGKKLYVSHAGIHEISIIDWSKMKTAIKVYEKGDIATGLQDDLGFIYPFRKRISIQGNGPRSLIMAENMLIAGNYFSNNLSLIETKNFCEQTFQLSTMELNDTRKGEMYFNDATLCFQSWQSCASCHPDARVDGLNWDLLNDGVGNPKNTRSMLLAHKTPPVMSLGVRASASMAVRAGFKYIQFAEVSEEVSVKVDIYLESLQPVKSPFMGNKYDIKAGEAVYKDQNCILCHSGPFYTDLKMYNFGKDSLKWDNPTLIEGWRTSPYWHDGKYGTMKELFQNEKHGIIKPISEKEIIELEAYLLTL